ncbi:MAG: ParA family protein [Lachnospiraceae bacterium]|nr:ParA family protein [Lachnospiraceae bacterium]
MRTISIISLKGGVAKTTTAVNMAYVLGMVHNKKVLVIDNDKQGNASKTFRRYDTEDKNTIARVMLDRNPDVSELIKATDYENIDIITANMDLLEANLRTIVDSGRRQQTRFQKALSALGYDFCIIDNAPDINMSIINALVMSDDVIIPIFIDQYSFDGLDILLDQIAQVQEDFNESLRLAGCLVTQYQNNDINNQGIEYLKNQGMRVFTQKIRRTEKKVSESTIAGTPLVEYSIRCGAAQDYKKFVLEYLEDVPDLGTH